MRSNHKNRRNGTKTSAFGSPGRIGSAEPATKVGHPAPFPVELPYRLIQLYIFKWDIVLDPFIGSGQTAIAAIKTERHYVGYDINEEYVNLAKKRIEEFSIVFESPKLFKPENRS